MLCALERDGVSAALVRRLYIFLVITGRRPFALFPFSPPFTSPIQSSSSPFNDTPYAYTSRPNDSHDRNSSFTTHHQHVRQVLCRSRRRRHRRSRSKDQHPGQFGHLPADSLVLDRWSGSLLLVHHPRWSGFRRRPQGFGTAD